MNLLEDNQPVQILSVLQKIAKAANFKVFQAENESQFEKILIKIKKLLGPIMIVVKIKNSKETSGRISLKPSDIKKRFTSK